MSKVSESILRGAWQALEYAKGHKHGVKVHHVKVPQPKPSPQDLDSYGGRRRLRGRMTSF